MSNMLRTLLLIFLLMSVSLLSVFSAVFSEEIFVRAGDLVALQCPKTRGMGNMVTPPSWTSYTPQKRILTSDTNLTTPLLIHKRSLVLLRVSPNQQGNYSCSLGNNTFWSKLLVLPHGNHKGAEYTTTCYTQERCSLWCPSANAPGPDIPNMTHHSISWRKVLKGERMLSKEVLFFPRVEGANEGTYTCTRSYRYKGQTYNRTFTNKLSVKTPVPMPDAEIILPQDGNVFEIELGSVFVVNCTATISSHFDEIFWMTDTFSEDTDTNQRVFSNTTVFANANGTYMTALLIFKEVVEDDLSKNFTCKLESVSVSSSFVKISLKLKQKKQETALLPILIFVAILLVTAVVALACVKFKLGFLLQDHFHTRFVPPP